MMKYIVCGVAERVYIFPYYENHAQVASALGVVPVRAGFIKLRGDEIICFGESVSLNVVANPQRDAELIRRYLSDVAFASLTIA